MGMGFLTFVNSDFHQQMELSGRLVEGTTRRANTVVRSCFLLQGRIGGQVLLFAFL